MSIERIIQLLPTIIISAAVLSAALWFLFRETKSVLISFYKLPSDYSFFPLVFRRLLPRPIEAFLPPVFIPIREIGDLPDNHWTRWLGGPAALVIYDGIALYLEQYEKYSRVVGAGLPAPRLNRHETIKAVIDLHPQIIERKDVKAWAKDGVEVKYSVHAEFKIASSKEAEQLAVILEEGGDAQNLVYPYDSDSVKRAIERTTVGYNNEDNSYEEKNWMNATIGAITGRINAYIAGHSINEILLQDENSPQLFSFLVSDKLFESINDSLGATGTQLLGLQIPNFSPVDKEISDGLLDLWKAEKGKNNLIREGEDDARRIRAKQRAQTIAQQELFDSLIENLSEMNEDIPAGAEFDLEGFSETAVLLMSQILDRDSNDPILKTHLAKEMLETLDALKGLLRIDEGLNEGTTGINSN